MYDVSTGHIEASNVKTMRGLIMNADISQVALARRRAGRRLGFLIHAGVFVAVNLALVAINVIATPAHPWAIFPLLGWGFGLLMHGLAAFGVFGRIYQSLVARELARRPATSGAQN
jgi:hypothetical protein